MASFSGKQNRSTWLSLASGMMEHRPKESPRLAAMERLRVKRAAAKQLARAAWSDHGERSHEEHQKPIKARKTVVEVHEDHAPLFQLLQAPVPQPPPLPRTKLTRRPTVTLQLLPVTTPLYRSSVIGNRRAWVTRADGERMYGWLRWSATLDDVVITCDCHNLMFSPEGFLDHAGLKSWSMDRPLRHIMVFKDPPSQQ